MITGGDEDQAESYELQLKAKLDNKEIPTCTKYNINCYVYSDSMYCKFIQSILYFLVISILLALEANINNFYTYIIYEKPL